MKGTWIRKPLNDITVVFLHGIISSDESCWTHSNGTHWPTLLSKEKENGGCGIYTFECKTGFFSGDYRLSDVVDALEQNMRLDGVLSTKKIVFVCHSMGGIVARRFIVRDVLDLVEQQKVVGLFLIASPSLGSNYANWLTPLANLLGHSQAKALTFADNNAWLLDLDKDFRNLKEDGRLNLRGKELVEDVFVVLPRLLWPLPKVVKPISGATYFGDALRIPDSNHFTIAKVPNSKAPQHRLLLEFVQSMSEGEECIDLPRVSRESVALLPEVKIPSIYFRDDLHADIVSCTLQIKKLAELDGQVSIHWPEATTGSVAICV